jgi:hypothetical protein
MPSPLRWEWVVNTRPRQLYPRERPGTHCNKKCVIEAKVYHSSCQFIGEVSVISLEKVTGNATKNIMGIFLRLYEIYTLYINTMI